MTGSRRLGWFRFAVTDLGSGLWGGLFRRARLGRGLCTWFGSGSRGLVMRCPCVFLWLGCARRLFWRRLCRVSLGRPGLVRTRCRTRRVARCRVTSSRRRFAFCAGCCRRLFGSSIFCCTVFSAAICCCRRSPRFLRRHLRSMIGPASSSRGHNAASAEFAGLGRGSNRRPAMIVRGK